MFLRSHDTTIRGQLCMKLLDLVQRTSPPLPWTEGEKIPWNEPGFSARMLQEHLTQNHDAASRRTPIIDQHVRWIHEQVLQERPASILDLGCGPGLYVSRLAALGHACTGIDFGPASIAYAQSQNQHSDYILADVREADYGHERDLIMLIFGEFNTFSTSDARQILLKAQAALKPGGQLILEPHTFSAVQTIGQTPTSWHARERGLFSEQPHIVLKENFWNEEQSVAIERYFIIEAASAVVTRHVINIQAYTEADYRTLLQDCDFTDVTFYPSLAGNDAIKPDLLCIVARKHPISDSNPHPPRKNMMC